MSVRLILRTSALAAAALATTAAFAHPSPSTPPYPDGPAPDMRPEWKGGPEGMPHHHPMPGADMQRAQWEQQRADWLSLGASDPGLFAPVGVVRLLGAPLAPAALPVIQDGTVALAAL